MGLDRRAKAAELGAGLGGERGPGEPFEELVPPPGGLGRIAEVLLVGPRLEAERAVQEERERVGLDEPVERGDGVGRLAGLGEERRAEVERLVAQLADPAVERRVERVERGQGLVEEAAAKAAASSS